MKKVILFVALLISVTSWAAEDTEISITLERPAQDGVAAGISTLHGWAIAQEGIDRVELFVNGVYSQDVPYGGLRADVGSSFPTYPNSDNSGFSVLLNYSELVDGTNEVLVRAYDSLGNFNVDEAVFQVERFDSTFITNPDEVDLSTASDIRALDKNTLEVEGITVEGDPWKVQLKWQTASQGYDINLTEKESTPPSEITTGTWSGPGACFHVSPDGQSITSDGSTCDNGLAFDSLLGGETGGVGECEAAFLCSGTWPIVDNAFTCYSDDYDQEVTGTFRGNNIATGIATESKDNKPCIAAWNTTPL
jgi:hypothetical protein